MAKLMFESLEQDDGFSAAHSETMFSVVMAEIIKLQQATVQGEE